MSTRTSLKCKLVGEFFHCRMKSPKLFDSRSFRTVSPNDDVRITTGCPVGKWDNRHKECTVSTQAQRIMYHVDACDEYDACRLSRKRRWAHGPARPTA